MTNLFCSGEECARLSGQFLEGGVHVRSGDQSVCPAVNDIMDTSYVILRIIEFNQIRILLNTILFAIH